MLSESQKRKGHLSILEKLRSSGMPEKSREEDGMEMMFAQVSEEGDIVPGSEAEKKKKKKKPYERDEELETRKPNLAPAGIKSLKDAFK